MARTTYPVIPQPTADPAGMLATLRAVHDTVEQLKLNSIPATAQQATKGAQIFALAGSVAAQQAATVINVTQQITNVTNSVTGIQGQITTLQAALQALTTLEHQDYITFMGLIATIQASIVTMQAQIAVLQAQVLLIGVPVLAYINASAAPITLGTPVYISAAGQVSPAVASSVATSKVVGLVNDASIASLASGNIRVAGVVNGLSGLVPGSVYYLDPVNAGKITLTAPTAVGQVVLPIGFALTSTSLELVIERSILL